VNNNSVSINRFACYGPICVPQRLAGSLHIVDSSTNAVDQQWPGGAGFFHSISIRDAFYLDGPSRTDPRDWLARSFDRLCGEPGELGSIFLTGALPGGETHLPSLPTGECAPNAPKLSPGQETAVVVSVQLGVNRGGFVRADRTFNVGLADELPLEAVTLRGARRG
jgi:hypothetical protein